MINSQHALVSFDNIENAVSGDVLSIGTIINHYSAYIAKLCMQSLYDEHGRLQRRVNEDMRKQLENRLIAKILDFRINF